MKEFLIALQFLTIIPVKIKEINKRALSKSVIYFPLVGVLLGLVLTGVNNLFSNLNFSEFSINIALVILLIVLTGGLHLDGLADTADALLSRKGKEDMLMIMRDSHIGAMGVLSLISAVLLKIAFLSSISLPFKTNALFLVCLLSRWSLTFLIFLFPYARQEGKAEAFKEGMNLKIFALSTAIALFPAFLIWGIKALLFFTIIAVSSYFEGKFINSKITGITGDTLGASCELNEIIALLSISIFTKSFL